MKFFTDDIRNNVKVIFLALILALAVGQADADYVPWQGAKSQPPGCFSNDKGCDAPLNTSSLSQIKRGELWLNSDDTDGTSVGLLVEGRASIGSVDGPDSSAQLEVKSTNKGFLPPRIANTTSITSPATGLLIYNTTAKQYQYNSGTGVAPSWQSLGGAPPKTVALYYDLATNPMPTGWVKCDGATYGIAPNSNTTPDLRGVTMTGEGGTIPVYYICKL